MRQKALNSETFTGNQEYPFDNKHKFKNMKKTHLSESREIWKRTKKFHNSLTLLAWC